MLTDCSLFQQIKLIKTRIGFGILDSVLPFRNNSGLANYSEMPIPSRSRHEGKMTELIRGSHETDLLRF